VNSYSIAERINSDVNASVTYKTDLEQYAKPEFWTEAGKFGDCEDYALLKRAYLLEQGWPIDKLNLCCCWCNHLRKTGNRFKGWLCYWGIDDWRNHL